MEELKVSARGLFAVCQEQSSKSGRQVLISKVCIPKCNITSDSVPTLKDQFVHV